MKRKEQVMSTFFLLTAILLAASGSTKEPAESTGKVSRPFEYSGYTSPEYRGFTKSSAFVPMRDGTKLAVDIFLPSDGPPREAFPVILQYTPYQRAMIDLKPNWFKKTMMKSLLGTAGPVIDLAGNKNVRLWLSHGYACVAADIRGSGASFGWKADLMPIIGFDGKDLVDWIAGQKWCDGNVGMYGGSYVGYSQLVTASHKPEALKCILPIVAPFDPYMEGTYPGGIYNQGFAEIYSSLTYGFNMNYYNLNLLKVIRTGQVRGISLPAAPVIDEDGDGDLIDEVPMDLDGDGSFIDEPYPPTYRDDQPRYNNFYFNATMEHYRGNVILSSASSRAFFIDTNLPGLFENLDIEDFKSILANYELDPDNLSIYDINVSGYVKDIMESGVPIYNWGGWFDVLVRGTTELYCTLNRTNPSKMLLRPSYHSSPGPFADYLGIDMKEYNEGLNVESLRFFDRYLKGIENGIDREPPVCIYVMNGQGWRFENEWPLERQVLREFYFDEGNRLSASRGIQGRDNYRADYTHDSRHGRSLTNRYIMHMPPGRLPVRTEKDKKCLTYTSGPMTEDTEVTGHPAVSFWVSSTADYGDFFVYLEDVDEKGEAILIGEGQLRAGFANLYDNDEMIHSGRLGIDVLPDLPWHGFEEAEYQDRIFSGGNIVQIYIDFTPVSWVFREGHSVRVSIACADWPTFRLHPKLSPNNMPDDPANVIPTITVYRDEKHPSRITLPVIPK